MGLFGNWRKDKYCPNCFGNKGAFFGWDFICDNCRTKFKEEELLNYNEMIPLKRKEILNKIKDKLNVKNR